MIYKSSLYTFSITAANQKSATTNHLWTQNIFQNAFDGKEYTYWHPGHNGKIKKKTEIFF